MTSCDEVEVTGREEVNMTACDEVDVTGRKKVTMTACDEVEVTGREEVNMTACDEVDVTGREEVNLTSCDEVEVTGREEVNMTACNEIDVTGREEVKMPACDEIDVTGHEEVRIITCEVQFEINPIRKQNETINVDLFDDLNLGLQEEVVDDVDMINLSGNLNVDNCEQESTRNRPSSDSEDSSSSEDEEHNGDRSIFTETPHNSNNKPKRPLFEQCLICEKSVKKTRDHLRYYHKLNNNTGQINFCLPIIPHLERKSVINARGAPKECDSSKHFPSITA